MTHPEPFIRPARLPEDIETCAEIWVRALEARDGTVDESVMTARVREAFERPIVRCALVTAPRRGFSLVEAGRDDPSEAFLHFLAVDPGGAGGGAGRALLTDAIEHSRAEGFSSLVLEVRDINTRAIELYTRNGFVPFGDCLLYTSRCV